MHEHVCNIASIQQSHTSEGIYYNKKPFESQSQVSYGFFIIMIMKSICAVKQ